MSVPPCFRDGPDCESPAAVGIFELRLHRLGIGGEDRWWYTRRASHMLDRCLAASLGRKWPIHALRARAGRWRGRGDPAYWDVRVAAFLKAAGLAPVDLVAQLGTPGHYRKFVMTLLGDSGAAQAILKCSVAPSSRASIRAEAEALSALSEALPGVLPRMLGATEIGGRTYSLQTPVPGVRSRGWTEAHHQACLGMFSLPSTGSWGSALARRELVRARLAASGGDGARISSVCGRLLDRIDGAAEHLPLGWVHRDFTASNVWTEANRLSVIDWEWADPAWAPGHDLLHFHLLPWLRRGDVPVRELSRLAMRGEALDRYARALGMDGDPWLLASLYLYELILFYADADDSGSGRIAEHPVIASACVLADTLPQHGRRKPVLSSSSQLGAE